MPIPNGGLITETNRQYYAGAQQFTVPATAVNQTFTSTFDTNLIVGTGNYSDPGTLGYNGYHKAMYAADNIDSIAKHFYEQGKSDATKDLVAKSKNIKEDIRQTGLRLI